ncbi:hypothetical protein Btru_006093 [Bulinus truncatus]|nr:hypothetical protein Btru_006093 [Bulinus truncatus]
MFEDVYHGVKMLKGLQIAARLMMVEDWLINGGNLEVINETSRALHPVDLTFLVMGSTVRSLGITRKSNATIVFSLTTKVQRIIVIQALALGKRPIGEKFFISFEVMPSESHQALQQHGYVMISWICDKTTCGYPTLLNSISGTDLTFGFQTISKACCNLIGWIQLLKEYDSLTPGHNVKAIGSNRSYRLCDTGAGAVSSSVLVLAQSMFEDVPWGEDVERASNRCPFNDG